MKYKIALHKTDEGYQSNRSWLPHGINLPLCA